MEPFEFAFHSDEDGGLWMHSDDPASVDYTVTVTRHGEGGAPDRVRTSAAERNGPSFLGLGDHQAVSAWFVGRVRCRIDIVSPSGTVTSHGSCRHVQPG